MEKERNTVTISDSGIITVPNKVRMTIGEIADLFDIYYQTAKKHIRAIEKSGIAEGDHSMSGTVEGMTIYPDYYGLEMVIAIAFRIQSKNAGVFRKYIILKATRIEVSQTILLSLQNAMLN
jgi:predicted transcriptional regulator